MIFATTCLQNGTIKPLHFFVQNMENIKNESNETYHFSCKLHGFVS